MRQTTRDGFFVCGLASIGYGVSLLSVPAAFIVIGVMLASVAAWGHFNGEPS